MGIHNCVSPIPLLKLELALKKYTTDSAEYKWASRQLAFDHIPKHREESWKYMYNAW